jgi:guanylate kinase
MKSLKLKQPWSESANKSKTWSEEGVPVEARGLSEDFESHAYALLDSAASVVQAELDASAAPASRLTPHASSMIAAKPGKLVVISGPSGVGKSTVVRHVLEECGPGIKLSVSATTRPPRPGERDGVDYYFLSDAEFQRRREAGEFLECIEVFGRGHWYGTLWAEVRSSLSQGKWVILEIDVDGAGEVMNQFPDAITIFIRGTENEDAVQRRLAVARHEMLLSNRYEHQIVNVTVPAAVGQIRKILEGRGFEHD